MDFAEIAAVCALELRRRKKMKNMKKYWVHPITSQRLMKGQFYELHNELRSYQDKFFNFYRMSVKSFDDLLNFIRPFITYRDTMWRKAIPPAERLSVTLSMVQVTKGILVECDTAMKQFLLHLDETGALGQKFILQDLDDTHLFISADVIETLQSRIDDLMDQISFPVDG